MLAPFGAGVSIYLPKHVADFVCRQQTLTVTIAFF
jgi:hypothetical protein